MKRLELHYNKKFTNTISSYSWIEIYRKRGCVTKVTMTYNRAEDWGDNLNYDFTNDFAIHLCDERFSVTHIHMMNSSSMSMASLKKILNSSS